MPTKKTPAYLLHKPTGQARVRIDGRDHYLGTYGTPESRERYEDLITAWLRREEFSRYLLTIDEIVLLYLDFAAGYYIKNGSATSEIHDLRAAVRPLIKLYGLTRARDFGPVKLKRVRDEMILCGWCRNSVNGHCHRIRRMFRWAVENEHLPGEILIALSAVAGLKRGKTAAPDRPPVCPVTDERVDATLAFLSPVVADMVRLQRLTGMRPAEVCMIRPCDIDRSEAEWVYRPSSHKTQHRGRERVVFIGPQGQAVLQAYLARADEAYCFSPAESEEQRRTIRHAERKTPAHHGNRPGSNRKQTPKRPPGERFNKDSYGRAIARACEKAFPLPEQDRVSKKNDLSAAEIARRKEAAKKWRSSHRWTPNQLRHSFATKIRKYHGLEAAQVLLGHSAADVTQVYAERDMQKAAEVMRVVG